MKRNKQIYIFLLFVCMILVLYTVNLLLSRSELSQPVRSVLIKQGDEHIVRFDITNTEPVERNYTISVLVDGKRYNENIFLDAGRKFTYRHHIYPPLEDNRVIVSIYKEQAPLSENIYTIGG